MLYKADCMWCALLSKSHTKEFPTLLTKNTEPLMSAWLCESWDQRCVHFMLFTHCVGLKHCFCHSLMQLNSKSQNINKLFIIVCRNKLYNYCTWIGKSVKTYELVYYFATSARSLSSIKYYSTMSYLFNVMWIVFSNKLLSKTDK